MQNASVPFSPFLFKPKSPHTHVHVCASDLVSCRVSMYNTFPPYRCQYYMDLHSGFRLARTHHYADWILLSNQVQDVIDQLLPEQESQYVVYCYLILFLLLWFIKLILPCVHSLDIPNAKYCLLHTLVAQIPPPEINK